MRVKLGYESGMLVVIGRGPGKLWLCRCECGTEKLIRYDALHKGTTTSCGCNDANETRRLNALDRANDVWRVYVRLASMAAVARSLRISKKQVWKIIHRLDGEKR